MKEYPFLSQLAARNPHQPEYLQAVQEWYESIQPSLGRFTDHEKEGLLNRLVEPERIIQFRVCWVDDQGQVHVNRGYRVQHSSAIGPFKGGLRFHPTVNLSVLKFLAFEQTFKNSLTTLPMGGGKGGADFDPKGKSDGEIMRFCHAFMLELYRHIGSDTDIPAGDIGVGKREVGYLNGMYKKISNRTDSVLTGKGLYYGGSQLRPEATGYGLLYFVQGILAHRGEQIAGKTVGVSGAGNVAQFAIEKALQLGAVVVTASDSTGFIHDPAGFTQKKLQLLQSFKNDQQRTLADYALQCEGVEFYPNERPWRIPMDIALPCATQNELDADDARLLLKNGITGVAEGANMPCTLQATELFQQDHHCWFAPGKAANAGGVATSGLEMTQNATRLFWSSEKVDQELHRIMADIHQACVNFGTGPDGHVDYVRGANVASFYKVAEATLAQGVV